MFQGLSNPPKFPKRDERVFAMAFTARFINALGTTMRNTLCRRRLSSSLRILPCLVGLTLFVSAASAVTVTSNGTGGGNWSSTTTWAGGVLPTAADDAVIANGDTVTIDTAAVCNNLTVGQG